MHRITTAVAAMITALTEHCPWCPGTGTGDPDAWVRCNGCGREFQLSDGKP